MPKQVDHDQRRESIAALVVDVIQSEGAENATVRRISEQGGFSVGVITHYFRDKDELIASAFQWLAGQSFAALETTLASTAPGLPRLRAALEFMVPPTGERTFPAVWLSLWSGAMHNPRLAQVHRRYYARWRRMLAKSVQDAVSRREARLPADLRDTIDLLAAGVDGLWIAITFEGRRFSSVRRRKLVADLVAAILGVPRPRAA